MIHILHLILNVQTAFKWMLTILKIMFIYVIIYTHILISEAGIAQSV
jgi:hypothetical protein